MSNILKVVSVFFLFSFTVLEEPPLKKTWQDLANVTFSREFIEAEDNYFHIPKFGKSVLELNGKTVELEGYFIPFQPDLAVLSQRPMASCFFCGGAGPETMAEVQFAIPTNKYRTDQRLRIKGTFRTNDNDLDHMNYILENAEVVAEI